MAHLIEMRDGKAQMAYAGELPWHGLGKQVPGDVTPDQMLEAAGLNWNVVKCDATVRLPGDNPKAKRHASGWSALVRTDAEGNYIPWGAVDSENAEATKPTNLNLVSNDWNPLQNAEAFEFFNDFVAAGDMEMHTAGSLEGGKMVWALAKMKDGFELFGGDQVDSYLLFTNPHKFGFAIDVRFSPIRVVCNNTLTLALSKRGDRVVRVNHRQKFDADQVKETLGFAKQQLAKYKEAAQFLGKIKAKDEDIVSYFKRIFPVTAVGDTKMEISRNAKLAREIVDQQPGHDFAPGTWWQAFNAVTFLTDHVLGRSADTRLNSAWYGYNRQVKTKALNMAMDMAKEAA